MDHHRNSKSFEACIDSADQDSPSISRTEEMSVFSVAKDGCGHVGKSFDRIHTSHGSQNGEADAIKSLEQNLLAENAVIYR